MALETTLFDARASLGVERSYRFDTFASVTGEPIQIVRLRFERARDERIRAYRVVRALNRYPRLDDPAILEVDQPAQARPVEVDGEILERLSANVYRFKFGQILSYTLYLDGHPLPRGYVVNLDPIEGVLQISPEPNGVLSADYRFDGILVYDGDVPQPAGVRYFGPVPSFEPGSISPPAEVRATLDPATSSLVLVFSPAVLGNSFYQYGVYALDDESNRSALSNIATVPFDALIDPEPYQIEEEQGNTWVVVKRTSETTVVIPSADKTPPHPPAYLTGKVDLHPGLGTADVRLTWGPSPGDVPGESPRYRVRVRSGSTISAPSKPTNPIWFAGKVTNYRVRRKVYDGVPPSFAGDDAETLGNFPYDTFEFVDKDLQDGTFYHYGVFAIDGAGNVSAGTYALVSVGDATPPGAVQNLKAALVQL